MHNLEKRLRNQLQQNSKIKIIDSARWSIPIHSVEVEYKPVKRSKMDILMKMMLISFQKVEIEGAEQLSELLLVEQLFVEDLISIMKRTGLLEKKGKLFTLTEKGSEQLKNGVFEEEQETETQVALYSICHQTFLHGVIKPAMDGEAELETYRFVKEGYLDEELSFEDEVVIDALQKSAKETTESDIQTVISEIQSTTELYIDDIPCLEFIIYNEEEDALYARVWNTLLEKWDEQLEHELEEKERITWRKRYLS